jgi:hypothetical protein
LLENLLEGFQGWLMTDGWISYRGFPRRLPLASAIGVGRT